MTFLQKRKVDKLYRDTMKYSGFSCITDNTIYVRIPKLSKYWIYGKKKTISQKKSAKYKKELYELSFEQQSYYKELCSKFLYDTTINPQRNSKDFDLIFTDPYDLNWSLGI